MERPLQQSLHMPESTPEAGIKIPLKTYIVTRLFRGCFMNRFFRIWKVPMPAARGFRTKDHYLVCFFLGLVAGTVIANFLYPSLREQAGFYFNLLDSNLHLNKGDRLLLFEQVLKQRLVEVWIAWLVGMTAYAFFLFCLFTAGIGFGMGFVLSIITVQKGLMGLPVFLMTLLPQVLVYIPLWCLLLFWGMQKKRHFRIAAFLLCLVFTIAGSACEAWINPFFLKIML